MHHDPEADEDRGGACPDDVEGAALVWGALPPVKDCVSGCGLVDGPLYKLS